MKQLLYKAVKFVGRSEVSETLVYLGLLGQEELRVWLEGANEEVGDKLPKSLSRAVSYSAVEYSLVRVVTLSQPPCLEPPRAADSVLAQGCMQLASSQLHADMEFVLDPATSLEEEIGGLPIVIRAHRVIVASRCEWACRALQSGMREAQER